MTPTQSDSLDIHQKLDNILKSFHNLDDRFSGNSSSDWEKHVAVEREYAREAIEALYAPPTKKERAMTPTEQDKELREGYIKVQLDYAPTTNGKKFKEWCKTHGFDYLGVGRRAWCSSLGTYFRDALGVAYNDGQAFLFYEDDVVDIQKLINQQVLQALAEVKGMWFNAEEGEEVVSLSDIEDLEKQYKEKHMTLEALEEK